MKLVKLMQNLSELHASDPELGDVAVRVQRRDTGCYTPINDVSIVKQWDKTGDVHIFIRID